MRAIAAALLVLAVLGGCMPRSKEPPDMHTSRNALDWAGRYEGVLPCADCPGIKTQLVLHPDGRFELQRQYIDRSVAAQTTSGRFLWNNAGNTIILDATGSGQQFRVGEGRLLLIDRDGKVPPWDTPNRVLTLQASR